MEEDTDVAQMLFLHHDLVLRPGTLYNVTVTGTVNLKLGAVRAVFLVCDFVFMFRNVQMNNVKNATPLSYILNIKRNTSFFFIVVT